MKVAIVSRHFPDAEGTAGGRALFALAEGVRSEGHDLRVWSWGPDPPSRPLPGWCEWRALPTEPAWRTRGRAAFHPRWDAARLHLPIEDDDVAVADTPVSFAAVAGHPRSVATVHHSAWLDFKSVGPRSPARLQDVRAERRAVRDASLTVAYSARVARALRRPAVAAPIAYPVPPEPLAPGDAPVAACVADWTWPANAWALRKLLECWPVVCERVPAATLVLAGRGLAPGRPGRGITAVGPVASSAEILGGATVVAFPCPPTTGPKVKVLEALASGRAVVTTAPGLEGLWLDGESGAVAVAPDAPAMAAAVADLLLDPERCAALGRMGRQSISGHHAPRPAARARIEAWSRLA